MTGHFEFSWIDTHEMIDRGMDVGHIVGVFDRMVTQFISSSVSRAAFDPGTRHPDTESKCMMVTSIGTLCTWCTSKFCSKHDDCVIEQTTAFQVFQ